MSTANFQIVAPFQPAGDQPQAIAKLVEGFRSGQNRQVLLGAIGTGKTFTAAHVIAQLQRPALVPTANRYWAYAKAWLYQQVAGEPSA